MAESRDLWTFADAVEWTLDTANSTGVTEERRKARRAVLDAYRELTRRDNWGYYQRLGQFTTEASQTTGTVAYDHSGGTYERQVTLSSATWPTNARYGTLIIGDEHYLIEDRKSSTVVTLRYDSNPGADVASGTSYTYYRNSYPVPIDFKHGNEPLEFGQSGRVLPYIRPDDWLPTLAVNDSPQSWSTGYTIRGVTDDYNTLAFQLAPPPSTARTYTYLYHAGPRPLQMFGASPEYSTGSIAVSGTTVTGTGTTWSERMEGCVIRFPASGTSTVPTGQAGAYGNDNPAAEYRIVQSVASTTSLTIDQSLAGTYSDVKYTIGDPLDLDYHAMLDAFLAMCEWKFAIVTRSSDKIITAKEAAFARQFARARDLDDRTPSSRTLAPLPRYWNVYAGVPL